MPMPPMPPGMGAQAGPQQGGGAPSMMSLAGMQSGQGPMGQSTGAPPGMGGPGLQTPGMTEISSAVVRMGAEIDQALKLLAQSLPQLAPWVEKTALELRYQIGTALNSGAAPTSPVPADNERFPDGGGNL